jgi:hypothetical protein
MLVQKNHAQENDFVHMFYSGSRDRKKEEQKLVYVESRVSRALKLHEKNILKHICEKV